MPKSTFFKLTEEKQKYLINAAMYEFSRSSFDEVKISNIIKLAKIPRSSFYDYFDDKEDLFLHLLSIVKETKQTYMAPYLEKKSISFFDRFREILTAGAFFAAEYPEYERLANKLYENKQLMNDLLGENQQSVVSIYEGLIVSGMESGELKPDIDSKFISECIYHLSANLFVDVFKENREETGKDSINEKLEKLLSFLKNGIGVY